MKNFPAEILCKIFYYLDLNEILKYRSVNKEWNSIIKNNLRIKNLTIDRSFRPLATRSDYYFCTGNLNLLRSSFNSILKNLKKLSILDYYYMYYPLSSCFNFINQFTNLEHLKIEYIRLYGNEVLNLPNLRIFSSQSLLDNYSTSNFSLRFKTPKLSDVEIFSHKSSDSVFMSLEFDFPALITRLFIDHYRPDILQFVNLERLDLKELNNFPLDILILLPKLKSLSCLGTPSKYLVSEILTSKKRGMRVDFNFYFFGMEINCKNDLDNFDTVGDGLETINKIKHFKRILDNFNRLPDVVPFITKVHFNTLIRFYNGKQIDQDFFDKFVNVKKLVVDSSFDIDQLVCFMRNYKLLNLKFMNCSLKQEFFNQLPIYQRNIYKLKIEHFDEKQRFDFKFILEFMDLSHFRTNLTVPCFIISKIINRQPLGFECIESIKFKLNDFDISAHSSSYDGKHVIEYRNEIKRFDSLKKLTNYLEELERSDRLDYRLN